jgi:hypothetical protein
VTGLFLLLTQLKVLGSLDTQLLLRLTFLALQTQDNLTGRLGFFVKDGLGLPTKAHLLRVVTALALCKVGSLAGLVLGDLVELVLVALACTVGLALLGNIHHYFDRMILC